MSTGSGTGTPITSGQVYGTVAQVAALAGKFTKNGVFDSTTNPKSATVQEWLELISAQINIALAQEHFAVPITEETVAAAISHWVSMEAADLAQYANSAGRFFSDQQFTSSPAKALAREALEFIQKYANGFEAMGATRTSPGLNGLDARITDDSGAVIEPMFSRRQFGNRNTDWDVER